MAAVKVKKLWTAFISLLIALLAPLGFANSATAASQPAAQQPESSSSLERTASPSVAAAFAQRQAVVQERELRGLSLPPTIKQRITAEAHGASPAVRRLVAQPGLSDASHASSPIASAVLTPASA
ncbi:DUF6344 domain-containing protein [Streptomyces sp. NPDC000410]|uniref:DUF6344 domain-containing protein n=1 Tax=Streptomyces sp. NPDC000410 TaxID=3154254 RepID=UPI003330B7F4